MKWQDDFVEKLTKYSGYKLLPDEDGIRVRCENSDSFEIAIYRADDEYLVCFGGWHEHFENIKDAKDCFAFGFSERCRLMVTLRGDTEYKWTVQSLENNIWENDSTTCLLLTKFWKPKNIQFRRNILKPKK